MSARVEVHEANSREEQRAFLRLPWRLYRADPHWVPPLLSTIARTLDTERNPFFEHAEVRLYLAWRDGRPVGRIAAIVDGLHNDTHHEKTGFWGFFETERDPDVARALLDRAADDLRKRGMAEMRGPMSPSINGECGLLIEGFDDSPYVLMPYNPPYYAEFVEQAGLQRLKDFYAYFIDPGQLTPDLATRQRLEHLAQAIRKRHPELLVRPLDMRHFEAEVVTLGKLFNEARRDNWGFVPASDAELRLMARDMKPIVDPQIALLAEVAGETVGCAFALPDVGPILKKMNGRLFPFGWLHLLWGKRSIRRVRIIGYGALPAYRHMGVTARLMAELMHNTQQRGYNAAELGWVCETNAASVGTIEHAVHPRLYKRYRVYTKLL